ncbi:MAG: hypothetical protein CM15mP22_6160 [Gammaproteobacteria bacterium]|nr:MAG: hypothetical protein CM15mP22_6160 [Gammaproteobacteria bacterium]
MRIFLTLLAVIITGIILLPAGLHLLDFTRRIHMNLILILMAREHL